MAEVEDKILKTILIRRGNDDRFMMIDLQSQIFVTAERIFVHLCCIIWCNLEKYIFSAKS